jgi:hypothetical protein
VKNAGNADPIELSGFSRRKLASPVQNARSASIVVKKINLTLKLIVRRPMVVAF